MLFQRGVEIKLIIIDKVQISNKTLCGELTCNPGFSFPNV
jgi:hypothetical protein